MDYNKLLVYRGKDRGCLFLLILKKTILQWLLRQRCMIVSLFFGVCIWLRGFRLFFLWYNFFKSIFKWVVRVYLCVEKFWRNCVLFFQINLGQGVWFRVWVKLVVRLENRPLIEYTADLLIQLDRSDRSGFVRNIFKFCVFSLFTVWSSFTLLLIIYLVGGGWVLLFFIRVTVFMFPIALVFVKIGVSVIPLIFFFIVVSIWRSCMLEFLIFLIYPFLDKYILVWFWRILSFIFYRVLDPIVYEAQYWWNTFYYCFFLFLEYIGRILLRGYLRGVLESRSIFWTRLVRDIWLLRYKVKVQLVHVWRYGLCEPVLGWVNWYLNGQVRLWQDTLSKGLVYVMDKGDLWKVSNLFSIIPLEQYPKYVKIFWFCFDRRYIKKWEDFFYQRIIYAFFLFCHPVCPFFFYVLFALHLFCYYVIPFLYRRFYRLVFFIFRFLRFTTICPRCIIVFVFFDDLASYVGYCYTWYMWISLRTILWPFAKLLFCFVRLPERLLVLSFYIVKCTLELFLYLVVNRLVFWYFAIPVWFHDFYNITGDFADCYSLWRVRYVWRNWSSIMEMEEILEEKRRQRRKIIFLRYFNRFVWFRNARLRRYWGFWVWWLQWGISGVSFWVQWIRELLFFLITVFLFFFIFIICSFYGFVSIIYDMLNNRIVLIFVWGGENLVRIRVMYSKEFFEIKYKKVALIVSSIVDFFLRYAGFLVQFLSPIIGVGCVYLVKLWKRTSSIRGWGSFILKEVKFLFLFLSLYNTRAHLRHMEGRRSFLEVVMWILSIIFDVIIVVLLSFGFEIVLFFKSVWFFLKICRKESRAGRGFVYQLIEGRVIIIKYLKEKYNVYKFFLDMYMLTFVFSPEEMENLLLPEGKTSFKSGDYLSKIDEWYASQSEATPKTFGEFLEENLEGERKKKKKGTASTRPEGSSYEERCRRKFLWTYRHFFSVWSTTGFLKFLPRRYSERHGRRPGRTPKWYDW